MNEKYPRLITKKISELQPAGDVVRQVVRDCEVLLQRGC